MADEEQLLLAEFRRKVKNKNDKSRKKERIMFLKQALENMSPDEETPETELNPNEQQTIREITSEHV